MPRRSNGAILLPLLARCPAFYRFPPPLPPQWPPQWPPHPLWTRGSGALGLGGASAIEGRAKVPRTAGVAVLLCLAARCATDRRRHVPRGSIIGVWMNRYHGQCTRHKIRSATRLVEQENRNDGMWWPCIRRHSRTLLEGDGVSDFNKSSPPHVVQAPSPTRFFTHAEAHPRPLSSPSAAHEQTGHDAALCRYGVQSSVLRNIKQSKAPEADSFLGSDQRATDGTPPLLDVVPLMIPASMKARDSE